MPFRIIPSSRCCCYLPIRETGSCYQDYSGRTFFQENIQDITAQLVENGFITKSSIRLSTYEETNLTLFKTMNEQNKTNHQNDLPSKNNQGKSSENRL